MGMRLRGGEHKHAPTVTGKASSRTNLAGRESRVWTGLKVMLHLGALNTQGDVAAAAMLALRRTLGSCILKAL